MYLAIVELNDNDMSTDSHHRVYLELDTIRTGSILLPAEIGFVAGCCTYCHLLAQPRFPRFDFRAVSALHSLLLLRDVLLRPANHSYSSLL